MSMLISLLVLHYYSQIAQFCSTAVAELGTGGSWS